MRLKSIHMLLVIAVTFFFSNNYLFGQKIPVTTSSEEARTFYLQGQALADKLRAQESIAFFEKAVEKDDQFAMAYLNLAFTAQSTKSFFENVDKAVALKDKVSEGEQLQILALQAAANGRFMEQLAHFKKLVEQYPNDERALNGLAGAYFVQQEFNLAIEFYEKAIAINPDFSPPYNQMGYAHRALENYDKAEKAFKKYIELIPDDPNPYDSYAELLLKLGRFDESIEQYKKALTQNPNFVASFVGIATNLDLQGKHETARQELKKLYDSAKNDGQRRTAHFATAVSYVYEGHPDKAIAEIKKNIALAKSINDAAAMAGDFLTIGNILLESGQPEKAMQEYKKALSVVQESELSQENKDNAALNYLYSEARVATKRGDLELADQKARLYLQGAEKIGNPFTIRQAHSVLGIIALEGKKYDIAIKELLQANQQNPYDLFRLARAYQGAGEKDLAKSFCKKAAHFNAINNMNQAFILRDAREMLTSLQ